MVACTKVALVLVCLSYLLVLNGCRDRQYVDRILQQIDRAKVAEVYVRWQLQEEDGAVQWVVLYRSAEEGEIGALIAALSDYSPEGGSRWSTRRVLSLGEIVIREQGGREVRFDVTSEGFFISGKRSLNALFYSPPLATFVVGIVETCEDRNRALLPEGLQDALSGR